MISLVQNMDCRCLLISILFFAVQSVEIYSQEDISNLYRQAGTHINNNEEHLAIPFLEIIDSMSYAESDTTNHIFANIYLSYCYFQIKEIRKLNSKLEEIESLYSEAFKNKYENLYGNFAYINALYYLEIGEQNLALYYLKRTLDNYTEYERFSFQLKDMYSNFGVIHLRNGDYHTASNYIRKALEQKEDSRSSEISFWYSLLGICAQNLNQDELAQNYYNTGFTYINKDNSSDKNKKWIDLLEEQISLNLKNNDLQSADKNLQLIKSLNPKIDNQIDYHKLKGNYLLKSDKFQEAKNNYDKCFELVDKYYSNFHYEKAEIFGKITEYWFSKGDFQSAIKNNTQVFQSLLRNDIVDNNPINTDPQDFIDGHKALDASKQRTLISIQLEDYSSFKEMAIYSTRLYNNLLSRNIVNQESKYFLREGSQEYFASIIEYALQHNDINFAFSISQFSHNLILRLQSQSHEAEINSGVPDILLQKSNELKLLLFKTKSNFLSATTELEKEKYNSTLVELDLAYSNLIKTFETQYPNYHRLKYNNFQMDIETFRSNHLTKKSALIEYFVSQNKIYIFSISKHTAKSYVIPYDDSFTQIVSNYNKLVSSIDESAYDKFVQYSSTIYNTLLAKIIQDFDDDISKLYIIPDDFLNYISFDALLYEKPINEQNRYDLLSYLCRNYAISYKYAGFINDNKKRKNKNKLISFAPDFSTNINEFEDLDNLLFNEKEVLLIDEVYEGKIHLDTSATLSTFKQSIQDYQIAHLATHASCNDSIPMEGKIYFQDEALHTYEIFNLPNDLDLVVLSACRTDDGYLQKGEGIISLARAFIASGCKSVVTTKWKVNDKMSIELLKGFYKHISEGKSYSTSLNIAKTEYINNVNSMLYAHPYYWAGFTLIGQDDIIASSHSINYYILICLLLFIFLLVFLWLRKRSK